MQSVDDGAVRWGNESPRHLLVVQISDLHVAQRQRRHAVLVDTWMWQHLKRVAHLDWIVVLLLLLLTVVVVVIIANDTCRK